MALVASLCLLHPQILSLEAVLFKGGRSLVYGTGRDIAFADRDAVAQAAYPDKLDRMLAA